MPEITNLNVQLNQNQIAPGTAQARPDGGAGGVRPSLPDIRSGTLVEGQVLSRNGDGSYNVRLDSLGGGSRTLLAHATVDLIAGERFRAVWDSSGGDRIPVLRLSQSELSILTKMPLTDREMANALLSRGMPLSEEVLRAVREAWRRMGSRPGQLGPLLELWARDLPMTSDSAQVLAWYASLSGEAVNTVWARIRKELKERSAKGENPVDILRELKEGEGETAKFLQGHSMLLRAPREDVNPALLGAPLWPGGDMPHIPARVFVGRVHEQNGRRYWQVGFAVEGPRLGPVGGDVESDGRSYNLNLYAERLATCELLKRRRHAIRKELEGVPLALQFIGISQGILDGLRRQLLAGRGLDITV
ncbi:MAG: hypothetical protein LBR71_01400 [Synergistaceae bacterium]|jgi:hypothetical protein|nr:hypothetical protein [Synergistaceae bacterium]